MKAVVKKIAAPVGKVAAKVSFKVKKHSPEILLGVGIVGIGVTVVTACKATLKAGDILDEYAEAKEKIEEAKEASKEKGDGKYTEADEKKDKIIAYKDMAIGFAKLYWPSAAVGALSVGCILWSYGIMKKREIGLISAYTALQEGFKRYRAGVVEKYGKEVDKELRTGLKAEKKFVTRTDEDGNQKTEEEEVMTIDDAKMLDSMYFTKLFSESTSTQYTRGDSYYNEAFLKAQEAYFNQLLGARGYVFLSEVMTALGLKVTPESILTGWIKEGNGDGFVDFGIVPVASESGDSVLKTGRIVKTWNQKDFMLDFNVDGVIWNLI